MLPLPLGEGWGEGFYVALRQLPRGCAHCHHLADALREHLAGLVLLSPKLGQRGARRLQPPLPSL